MQITRRRALVTSLLGSVAGALPAWAQRARQVAPQPHGPTVEWRTYGGDLASTRYST
jgi:hypothetical protein